MKFIYQCFGGAHTSITCASIHLNYLPNDRIPEYEEFKSVPFYDKMKNCNLGTFTYMGKDEFGWEVYTVGMRNGSSVVIPAVKSLLNQYDIDTRNVLFVNALAKLHPVTSIGGFASRKLGLISMGRPMTIWGIRKSYNQFIDLVGGIKEMLKNVGDFP